MATRLCFLTHRLILFAINVSKRIVPEFSVLNLDFPDLRWKLLNVLLRLFVSKVAQHSLGAVVQLRPPFPFSPLIFPLRLP